MADPSREQPTVAIVGAGMAGASCARKLKDAGVTVQVYEKARGAGGRAAVRRLGEPGGTTVDLGAQYFTVRENRFANQVDDWIQGGVAAPWPVKPAVIERGEILKWEEDTSRYVGIPAMNNPVKELLEGVPCTYSSRVENLARSSGGWTLRLDNGAAVTPQRVVLTPPPAQCADLIGDQAPDLSRSLKESLVSPTWCYYCLLNVPSERDFDAAFVNDGSPLDWVARNSSKPAREGPEVWVVHADHEWSRNHLGTPGKTIRRELGERLMKLLELPRKQLLREDVHRWRYAKPAEPLTSGFRREGTLFLAGDWLNGGRVEGAFMSGRLVADRISEDLL